MDDRIEIARDLWDRALTIAKSLTDDDWSRPTPCPEWTVHDMLAHLGAIQTMMDSGKNPPTPEGWSPPEDAPPLDAWTAVGVAARRDWSREEILAELHEARDGQLERLRTADPDAKTYGATGETTEDTLFRTRSFDLWVHLQDLRDALGQELELHDESPALRVAAEFTAAPIPYLLGKRVGAAEGSTLRVSLSAPLDLDGVLIVRDGRAGWDGDADAGDDSVTATPAAYALLVAGRGTPQRWRDAGVLDWSGDLGERFVQQARLF